MGGRRVSTQVAGATAIVLTVTCTLARAQSAADGLNPGANHIVEALLVGGRFPGLGGGTGTTSRNKIGRLNADGSVESVGPAVPKGSPGHCATMCT
jgi:hypothetical protein